MEYYKRKVRLGPEKNTLDIDSTNKGRYLSRHGQSLSDFPNYIRAGQDGVFAKNGPFTKENWEVQMRVYHLHRINAVAILSKAYNVKNCKNKMELIISGPNRRAIDDFVEEILSIRSRSK